MQLEDRLKICLLALESRYPEHLVDINPDVLTVTGESERGWTVSELLAYLKHRNPSILHSMARLVIDLQCSEIYLLEQSEYTPTFFVHCRGKIPSHEKHLVTLEH